MNLISLAGDYPRKDQHGPFLHLTTVVERQKIPGSALQNYYLAEGNKRTNLKIVLECYVVFLM